MRIWIVGSGVVGQATGRGLLRGEHAVTFVDIDSKKIEQLQAEGLTAVTPTAARGLTEPADLIMLSVPTPTVKGAIDTRYLQEAATEVGRWMKDADHYQTVVVRSTVLPGTTEELVQPLLEKYSGKKAGRDFGVCMNPEYLREKTAATDFAAPWIVVIGQGDERAGDVVAEAYQGFSRQSGGQACPVYRLTIREAEFQKYVHNIFNAVKIAFFNEFRVIGQQAGVDVEAVFPLVAKSAEGLWRPEYGIGDFGPFDGMCLPKDTQAFLHWAEQRGWEMPVLQAAVTFNNQQLAEQQVVTAMVEPAEVQVA